MAGAWTRPTNGRDHLARGPRLTAGLNGLLAGAALFMTTGCATDDCLMPGAGRPDRAKVLANASNGQAGREALAAAFDGDAETIRRLVAADPRVLDTKAEVRTERRPSGQWGDLMTIAVTRCDVAMVRALLDMNASPNGADYGRPLATALRTRTPEMAALLLDAGADPDPVAKGGEDVVNAVLAYGGEGAMRLLLRHGVDPNREGRYGGNTPLWQAVAAEQYAIAHLMIDHGGSLWVIDGTGGSPAWDLGRGGPIVFGGDEQQALHQRLIERAKLPGVPWPPPDLPEMRRMVLAGEWPTPAARAAGAPPVSERTLSYMREYYNADGSRRAGK